jgi:aryl-alcohol dehydrogenase-like predicted oxidoreductase
MEAAEKAARDKDYRAVDYAEEDGHVAEAVALAMAWGLLGKEEEDPWQVQRTHHRSAARDLYRRDRDEEASVARQARAAATVAAMHDAALAAVALEWVAEEESRKHYVAKINTSLVRHEEVQPPPLVSTQRRRSDTMKRR